MTTPSYEHRRGSLAVTVTDPDGVPVPGADVTFEQLRHAFGFGNVGFDLLDGGATALADRWLALFNHVTLPFYWDRFEPTPGAPDTTRLLAAARWFGRHGVTVKGHPLLWHTLAPPWLMTLSDVEVECTIRARILREVTDFAGVIDLWDAINEAVILPVFTAEENAVTRLAQTKGRVEMVRMAFEEARGANPAARLVLNDFDLTVDYEHLIEDCLAAGIQIDAIGVQTHMHQGFRGEDAIWDILERFGRFGLPIQMTETTLVSGDLMPAHIVDLNDFQVDSWPSTAEGEARQAGEMIRHYRTVVGHPAVESLTYWGLGDEGSWLGAPAGLLRRDGTPKPSYDALHRLIRGEWWTPPTTVRTDADGVAAIKGFAGRYRASARGAAVDVDVPRGAVATATLGRRT